MSLCLSVKHISPQRPEDTKKTIKITSKVFFIFLILLIILDCSEFIERLIHGIIPGRTQNTQMKRITADSIGVNPPNLRYLPAAGKSACYYRYLLTILNKFFLALTLQNKLNCESKRDYNLFMRSAVFQIYISKNMKSPEE